MRCLARYAGLVGMSVVLAAGCGGDGGDKDPVKVGLMAPKTGALMAVGESFERVAFVARDSINALGGVDGRQLELIVSDTETNADLADDKLQALIDQGVVAVVGPATSGEVTAAYPVARDNRVPIISPSSTAPALSRTSIDDGGYMFRNVPDDEIQGVAMAYFLRTLRQPTVASVAVVFEDTPYGSGLKDAFKVAFENQGGTVPQGHEIPFSQNVTDPGAMAAITAVSQLAPQPTMVVLVALEQDAIKLVNAWDNGGTPRIAGMQFFMTDGARSGGFLAGAPSSVRGMCGTAPTFPTNGLAYKFLEQEYEDAYPDAIGDQVFAPNVWDGFHLIAAALIQQARQHPGDPLGGADLRDAITAVSRDGQTFHAGQWRELISAIRNGTDVDYDGAAGPNNFDVVGQAVGPYEVWCVSSDGSTFDQAVFLEATQIQSL